MSPRSTRLSRPSRGSIRPDLDRLPREPDACSKSNRPGPIQCNSCGGYFTGTVGTVLNAPRCHSTSDCWQPNRRIKQERHQCPSPRYTWRYLQDRMVKIHRSREAIKHDGSPLNGEGKFIESDETFVSRYKENHLSGKTPRGRTLSRWLSGEAAPARYTLPILTTRTFALRMSRTAIARRIYARTMPACTKNRSLVRQPHDDCRLRTHLSGRKPLWLASPLIGLETTVRRPSGACC